MTDSMTELPKVFEALKKLLKSHRKGLEEHSAYIGSQAKTTKPSYHLYGKKEVAILAGRKPQKTYVAGVIQQKRMVSLYFMPIYSHPQAFSLQNDQLEKNRTGKNCFNIVTLDDRMVKDIDTMLSNGIALYKKEGWI
jgi:hypothetical protein